MRKTQDLQELKEQLTLYTIRAYDRRLIAAAGGNTSARIGDSNEFLITSSGLSLKDTRPENILIIDGNGKKLDGPDGLIPSKETGMHLAIYRHKPEAKSIFHLHPNYANIWGARRVTIPQCTVTAKLKLGRTPSVPPANSGSDQLHKSVEDLVPTLEPTVHTILLERHGSLTWGATVVEAFLRADLVEEQAKLAFCMELGSIPTAF